MAFTKLFAFAKQKVARRDVQATFEDVLTLAEDVHVRMHVNKKGKLVPYTVVHVKPDDLKPTLNPSSMTTLVGSPTFSAPSFVPGSKEVQGLTKAPVAEPEIATLSSDSDDVSHPVQLTGAFKDVDAACDSQSLVKREHITSRLRVVRLLSSGSYGQVFLVQDTKTRKVYALKVISKAALEIKSYALIFEEQDILRRVAGSPELLKLLASFEDKSNFYLLMDDAEPDFDMITIGSGSPGPSGNTDRSSPIGAPAPGEATASLARAARSMLEQRWSEDSTCRPPTDRAESKFSTVHRSDTPSCSTFAADDRDRVDDVAHQLASTDVHSYAFGSSERSSTARSKASLESSLVLSDTSTLVNSSIVAIAYASAAPARGWLCKLKSWLSWVGAKCSLRTPVRSGD
ncbi:hypothetical protein L227DRAFT_565991 [Lentinus tigrinus ALCF2SS1-6]|uniref:non-specific serine/threonine protein kinase n=1 Tax=Lentinus tigrinus ALCF2SS1-6 TaxID=1328759 RepID=A0A5C2RZX3_9APHY|nr:hypothetical protein L227DRAFT_565991 [Lentinus tigrinus ALCF2SS1-6]